jgi:adenine/guanine/hypoxanthine permease
MSFGTAMAVTCVSAALMCILMGVVANFPVSAAPLMGENLFFAFTIVIALNFSLRQALAIVLIEGILYLAIVVFKLRDLIVNSIPQSLKYAMSAGIGIYIVMLGLKWAGIIVPDSDMLVRLGSLKSHAVIISIIGLFAAAFLYIRGIKGSLTLGSLVALAVAMIFGAIQLKGVVGSPPSINPLLMKFQLPHELLDPDLFFAVIILLYMHIFSSLGGAINNKQAGAQKVLIIDALGTPLGACLGTSNVSSYVESNIGGISQSGRTGLSNVVTGLLFLAALFLAPLIRTIGAGVVTSRGYMIYPIAAPALILIGFLAFKNLLKLNLADLSETLPACITLVCVPMTSSIAHGIALGIISYPVIKIFQGKFREISPLMYVLAAAFLVYYIIR